MDKGDLILSLGYTVPIAYLLMGAVVAGIFRGLESINDPRSDMEYACIGV